MRFIFTPTLEGFRSLFVRNGFQTYLVNSILVAIPATLACVAVASPAAYALTQLRLRGRFFLAAILVARMVPGIAIVVPIYLAASRVGLLDTRTVLVVLYTAFNLPFAIWLLRGFFREVPCRDPRGRDHRRLHGVSGVPQHDAAAADRRVGGYRRVRVHRRLERIPVRAHPDPIERCHRAAVGSRVP